MKQAELDKLVNETKELIEGMTDKVENVKKYWDKFSGGVKKYSTDTRKALQGIVEDTKVIKKNILVIKEARANQK